MFFLYTCYAFTFENEEKKKSNLGMTDNFIQFDSQCIKQR